MPQSLARVIVHVIFSTKHRARYFQNVELRQRLHSYLAGTLQTLQCAPILINGVADHVHILCNLSRTLSLAELVEETKTSSSKWIKEQGSDYRTFSWQQGYGAFSVSQSNLEKVTAYVADQEVHHQTWSFQDEFRALCQKHGAPLDERYVWD